MAFELYSKKRSHGGPPAVSITSYGNFIVNTTAVGEYFQKTKFVHVYWDKDEQTVGLKPLSKKEDMSYQINFSPKGNVGSLSATSFLKHIGYDYKQTKSFPATWNDKHALLQFKIQMEAKPKRFPRLPKTETKE